VADEPKETNVVQIEYAELQFGEKIYQVAAAGLIRSESWRARVQIEVDALVGLLKEQGGIFENVDPGNLKETISNLSAIEMMPVIGAAFAQLNISMSSLGEIICLYSADLERDRGYILEHTTTRQAIAAVIEMVKFEFPFGMVFSRNGKIPGQPEATTLPNSLTRPGKSRRRN
jgi:hypothetical protein